MPTAMTILDPQARPRHGGDELSARYGELLTGSYDCVDRIVLNAYYPLGHSPGGFRTWWRRLAQRGEEWLDNAHLMRMAGRFVAPGPGLGSGQRRAGHRLPTGERKHRIAEDYLAEPRVGARAVPDPRGEGAGPGLGCRPRAAGHHPQPAQEAGIRQPLLVPHHGSRVGPRDDQDVRPPAVRRQVILNGHEYVACAAQAAGSASPRRATASPGSATRGPGSGRRHLVRARDYRAPEPGHATAGSTPPACASGWTSTSSADRLPLRLLGLPGRVQPQPDLRLGGGDGPRLRRRRRPDPRAAGRAQAADPVRAETAPPHAPAASLASPRS